MFGYPQPMYYQSQAPAAVQQSPAAAQQNSTEEKPLNQEKDSTLTKFHDLEVQSAAVAKALLLAHGKGEADTSDTEDSSK